MLLYYQIKKFAQHFLIKVVNVTTTMTNRINDHACDTRHIMFICIDSIFTYIRVDSLDGTVSRSHLPCKQNEVQLFVFFIIDLTL